MEFGVPSAIPAEYFNQRREFHSARKIFNESITQWYNRLLTLAQQCAFGSASNAFLLEKFIFGLEDEYVNRLSFEFEAITLERSIQITRHLEDSNYQNQFQAIYVSEPSTADATLIKLENEETAIDDSQVKLESKSATDSDESNSNDEDEHSNDLYDTNKDEDSEEIPRASVRKSTKKLDQSNSKRARKRKKDKDPNAPKKMHYKRANMKVSEHMEISEDFKRFTCKICGHSAKSKANVDVHISTHLNLRQWVCHYCGNGFNAETVLRKHIRTHTDERVYKCDVCPKAFRTSTMLKHHRNMHNNVKPFSCTVCNKAFRQKSHIIYHMRTHTGERPYECKICGNAFTQSCALKTHMKQHGNSNG